MAEAIKNKGGRPKKTIDFDLAEKLCEAQCNGEEIAAILRIDYDTLNRHIKEHYGFGFTDFLAKYSGAGKASLRKAMYSKAMSGNVPMMIWLSKQYLGMRDVTETILPSEIQEQEMDEYGK